MASSQPAAASPPPPGAAAAPVKGPSAALQKKLRKVLSIRTNTPDMTEALAALGEFYHENTMAARRQLLGSCEQRGVDVNEEFLGAFSEVETQLNQLSEDINGLVESCEKVRSSASDRRPCASPSIRLSLNLSLHGRLCFCHPHSPC